MKKSFGYKMAYFITGKVLFGIYFILTRIKFYGLGNIPKMGSVIFICNHIRNLDAPSPVFAGFKRGRYPKVFAKVNLWDVPILKKFLTFIEAIPVERNSKKAKSSLDIAKEHLEQNEYIVIFPEGTTSKIKNGELLKFKTGAARLALSYPGVCVIPAACDFVKGRLRFCVGLPLKFDINDSVLDLTNKMSIEIDKLLKGIRQIDSENFSPKRCCGVFL
ncbi:MAG: 1-acyl-sn-glycerol-3-phosphate acyltransferase [Bifidobacteriaceae bacterium]|jgi:1-acyl-sn-glycerol-3-phosphate acyltransferase|nr:1-acyl-sn-glycerol-3-phosphate acyltransferase [Bifidobacteriaceae bacterium]